MLLLEAADALQNPVAALHPALDGEALVQLRQPRLEALALKSRDGVLLELPALAGDAELRLRPVLLQKPRLRIEAARRRRIDVGTALRSRRLGSPVDGDPVVARPAQPFEVLLARDPGVHGDGRRSGRASSATAPGRRPRGREARPPRRSRAASGRSRARSTDAASAPP